MLKLLERCDCRKLLEIEAALIKKLSKLTGRTEQKMVPFLQWLLKRSEVTFEH